MAYSLLPCGHPLPHPVRARASIEHPFFQRPWPAPAGQRCSGGTRRRPPNRTPAEPPEGRGLERRGRVVGSPVNTWGWRSPRLDEARPTGSRQRGARLAPPYEASVGWWRRDKGTGAQEMRGGRARGALEDRMRAGGRGGERETARAVRPSGLSARPSHGACCPDHQTEVKEVGRPRRAPAAVHAGAGRGSPSMFLDGRRSRADVTGT